MVVPIVATEYVSTASGSVLKWVECEECGKEFVYRLERSVKGTGTSLYFIDPKGAQDHADATANKALRKLLEREHDVVPCPECGHVQSAMLPKAREGLLSWMRGLAWVLTFLAFGVGLTNWLSTQFNRWGEPYFLDWPLFIPIALAGPVLFILRAFLVRQYDPNSEPRETRREQGRSLALTKAQFEKRQREAAASGG